MVDFKSQQQIGGRGFTSWRRSSVILTFRAGVSVQLREWEVKILTFVKMSFIKLGLPLQSINDVRTVASGWKSLQVNRNLLCYKKVCDNRECGKILSSTK